MGNNKIKSRKIRINKESSKNFIDNNEIVDDVEITSEMVKGSVIRNQDDNINIASESEDQKLDRQLENDDNMSFAVIILILIVCFVVGIFVGYLLYRVAINNSNTMFIVYNFSNLFH